MRTRALPLVLACLSAASIADAQTPGQPPPGRMPPGMMPPGMMPGGNPGQPGMPGRPFPMPGPGLRPAADDCAISAMNVFVQARRTSAMVDVGLRVKAVKGGLCKVLPMAVQMTTAKGGNAGRPMSLRFVDGQVQRPLAMSEGVGGELLGPWAGALRPNEEKQIVLRYYVEGLEAGDVPDAVGRVAIRMRELGPRVYNGAPLNVKVSLESGVKASAKLSTGNAKAPAAARPTGTDGAASFSATLSKDDLAPVIEWRYEDALPAAPEADKLSSGLSVFEYLRTGLYADLAAGAPAPAGDKKDEKKDDDKKKEDPVATAWDRAFDVSLAAARSTDPVVAGMGQRTLAWLASGLSPAVVRVRAPGVAESPDSVEVPEKIATLVAKAADGFTAATGQKAPPSAASSPFARGALSKLGEPGSRKKEAADALKRLVARVDDTSKTAPTVGSFFSTAPAIALAPGVKTAGTQVIVWNRQGVPTFLATRPVAAPRPPLVQRIVRGVTHLRGLIKFTLVLTVLGAVITGVWWALRRRPQLAPATPETKPATDPQPA